MKEEYDKLWIVYIQQLWLYKKLWLYINDLYILRYVNVYEFAFIKLMNYYSRLYARKSVKKFAKA